MAYMLNNDLKEMDIRLPPHDEMINFGMHFISTSDEKGGYIKIKLVMKDKCKH